MKIKEYGWILFLVASVSLVACDALITEDEDKLSGDTMWNDNNPQNVEGFVLSMYNSFRKATMVEGCYFTAAGDLRCAPIGTYSTHEGIANLINNNMATFMTKDGGMDKSSAISNWTNMYEVVQEANIILQEIGDVPGIDAEQANVYRGEAIYMRSLAYFFLTRLFGDVPYYTNGYNKEPLPRTPMVTVLQNCLTDLQSVVDQNYLSWRNLPYRASKGSVVMLMMHINMWLLKFDQTNSATYYKNTIVLGESLVVSNAYELVDIESTASLFAGGTNESIFEIIQNLNKNQIFFSNGSKESAVFSNLVTYQSMKDMSAPVIYYTNEFIQRIFPLGQEDKRKELWFDENMYAEDPIEGSSSVLMVKKEIIKFLNADTDPDGKETSNAGNQIVFRYADALLLYAEALAGSNTDEEKARELLNQVRRRAGAPESSSTGQDLKDDIYWERVRELIGEGQYFFDLVRTNRLNNGNYCYHTVSSIDINQGAWTWPIDKAAMTMNPNMTLNNYWE